jgi:phospholipid/cholesterol/gamma-HCH transport system substrate-binding protein
MGGAVLAAALGFLLYAGQMTGIGGTTSGYELMASFRSAEGVTIGTDIRMAGVKIGSVTDMTLNPQTFMADVRFNVGDDIELPADSAISVASEGLLGGTFIEVLPGGALENIAPGGQIYDTQSAVSLITLMMRFATGSGDSEGAQ